MKALVGAFNQEKALVGAFSVIVQPVVEPMDRFAALIVMMEISRWELLLEINYCCELRIVMDGWHCILAQILCGLLQTTDNLFAKLS